MKWALIIRKTNKNIFKIIKCNTEFGERNSFNIAGISLCNKLGIDIKSFSNFNLFKNHIIYKILSCNVINC